MRFYWVRDRVRQGQFNIHWKPGNKNLDKLWAFVLVVAMYSGSLSHDPAGTLLLCSRVQTREVSLVCGRSISHDASCESGKSELNLVRNSESERL